MDYNKPSNAPEAQRKDTILIFSGLKGVVSWVVGGMVFEEGEGDFEEFVEDGDEDGHFGFTGGSESGRRKV